MCLPNNHVAAYEVPEERYWKKEGVTTPNKHKVKEEFK